MTVLTFLNHLRQLDVRVWVDGERLRFSAPPTVMSATLRAELTQRKSELLALLRTASASARVPAPIARLPRQAGRPLPPSFAQQRLWFLARLEPDNPAYNMPAAVTIDGRLEVTAIRRSLIAIVRRHESLRTRFADGPDGAVQIVDPPRGQTLPIVDLGALAAGRRELERRRRIAADARRRFDLERGPLLRTTLLRLGDEQHVLLLNQHHIVSDAWSVGVMIRELGTCYQAFVSGQEPVLPALTVQYADFAAWQRNRLRGDVLERQLAWWRERLAGAAPLELPTDRPRPAVRTWRGAQLPLALPAPLAAAVEALSREHTATPFMTLLAAFMVLLHRYSGQNDVAVGSPVAGRQEPEIENLIGFFVNTLVLRQDLGREPSFDELLARVRQTALAAYAHQEVPFEQLVEELQPQRDRGRAPLFQVMFALQTAPAEEAAIAGLTLSRTAPEVTAAKFDLTLDLTPRPAGLVGWIEYAPALYDASTVARLGRHFETLLASIVARPAEKISTLDLLAPAERWQLLAEWNVTATPYPHDRTVHELFTARVERAPEVVALVWEGAGGEVGAMTFRELDRRSSQLARYLRRRGVGAETLVGLFLERSPEMVVAVLAVLKAGGAYAPLDPGQPEARLALLLADARVPLVLTQERLAARLPADAPSLCLDSGWAAIAGQPTACPEPSVRPENLCYLMYTSGTTGTPKGIGVPHRGVVRLVRETDYAELGDQEVFLQLAPIPFDASTLEIWAPLVNGGRLVLHPPGPLSLDQLAAVLARHRITTLFLTTALFLRMTESYAPSLAPLGQLITGGEVTSPAHMGALLETFDGRLINAYGPTENTTITTCHPVRSCRIGIPVAIGRPIANTRLHLLDRHLEPVPVGVPGELCCSGDGLARGYHRRPALTAAAFVPDPFGAEPGERLYKTGDLARYLADGAVDFLGRIDAQVKIRGFRVEPGEVEAVLAAHPAVATTVVMVREDLAGDQRPLPARLVAYVVAGGEPPGGEPPAAAEFQRFLAERLPPYMVPAAFVLLEELPLTPNGKVDRAALGRRALPEFRSEEDTVAPRTPTEELLAGIWSRLLGVDQVGIEDDFFACGGHSLLATRLVSAIRRAFAVELPLEELFNTPTIAALAPTIEAALGTGPEDRASPPERVPRTSPPPLSFAQERLWFLAQLEPDNPAYNIPAAITLRGTLAVAVLAASLDELVRRHETLRTRFAVDGGGPVQIIDPPAPQALPVVDLTALEPARRQAEVERLAGEDAVRLFDLARGPLLRTTLVATEPATPEGGEHVLLLNQHHVISDGWSIGVLIRELAALYEAFSEGRSSPLAELPVQYADFAVWQRRWLSGEMLERQLAWWRPRLSPPLPVLDLPRDHPRPRAQTWRGARHRLRLPPELAAALRTLAREQDATLFMTLLAAFKVLLHRLSGDDDVLVGFPIAGRTRAEVEDLIGIFLNTLVVRTDLSGRLSFRDLLARVRTEALGAFAHQDVPFEKLLEQFPPERDLSRTPVFQVFFNMLNLPAAELRLPGLTLELRSEVETPSKFDLTAYVTEERAGTIAFDLVYNADLFDPERMAEMADELRLVLEQVAADADVAIDRLSLVTPRAATLLPDSKAVPAAEWQGAIHERIRARAQTIPERTAVVDGVETWSYGELLATAGGLARALRAAGLGPGDVVAVDARRCARLVPAILGVLSAGAAFLILDPAYPAARRRDAVRRARCRGWVRIAGGGTDLGCRRFELPPRDAAGEPPAVTVGPDDPAYVAFTSGSTGEPKGVVGGHGPVVHFLDWHARTFALTADDRFSLLSGLAHDPALRDLFTPLWLGATLVIPEADEIGTPGGPAAWLQRYGVSVVHLTPAMGRLVAGGDPAPALRYLFFGGDVLTGEDLRELRELAPTAARINVSGTTETPQAVAWFPVDADAAARETVPLGRGIADVQLLVLNGAGEPAGIGERGEIAVRTPYLASGYLDDPELTATRFPVHTGGGRIYRTGDLGRYLPDGNVEFAGRVDDQVKIRGFRIEPGEIEAMLREHPEVTQAVVTAREDMPGERYLAAYVVSSAPPEVRELRRFLKERLPDFMVPAVFVDLDALPLTANNKVDRSRLPAPADGAVARPRYTPPATPVEEALAEIFQQVTGRGRVGSGDDFFELGGHSLMATQVVSRIRDTFGIELPVRVLFEAPVVSDLALVIEEELITRVEALDESEIEAPAMSDSTPSPAQATDRLVGNPGTNGVRGKPLPARSAKLHTYA
ncbi:MAG: amino acid adenylation domain-containing protein [bacterium]|nr:amino acid adenylation domain-containing protein [bacterium]